MNVPPPDFAYEDSPKDNALVARSRHTGQVHQTVTYNELHARLGPNDLEYIEALTSAMESYQRQWNSVYKQRPMASGMELAKLDEQLSYLAREVSDPLIKILDFVQKLGLFLDDHYAVSRMVAEKYLNEAA